MTEAFLIYAYITLLSMSRDFAFILFLYIVSILGMAFALNISNEMEDNAKYFKKWLPFKIIIPIIVCLSLVPSKDDMKLIIGGALAINGVQAAANIEGVEQLPENLVGAMNHFLEEFKVEKE